MRLPHVRKTSSIPAAEAVVKNLQIVIIVARTNRFLLENVFG